MLTSRKLPAMFRGLFMSKSFVLITILGVVLLMTNLGRHSIYILDEAKNASCAYEMLQKGDFIVPTFNGELRTDKPPLHYYFMMAAYSAFGKNPFSARLFSGLFGIFTIWLVFAFAKRRFNERVAVWSSLTLLSSLHFTTQFHLATPDPYLIFFNTLALVLIFEGIYSEKRLWLYLGFVSIGLSCMVKGPVGAVLPGGSYLLYLIVSGRFTFREIGKLKLIGGGLVAALVAVPWYIMVWRATDGQWIEGFFLKHNLGRYTETMEGHGGIFILMPLLLLLGFMPFIGFVLPAFAKWFRLRSNNKALSLCGSAALFITLFFSFSSTKLPSYISPALPFAAILIGFILSELLADSKKMVWQWYISLALGIALVTGGYFGIKADRSIGDMPWLAMVFLPMPVGAMVSIYFAKRGNNKMAVSASVVGGVLAILLFQTIGFPIADARNPVALSSEIVAGKSVVAYKRFNPAFVFYQPTTITVFNDADSLEKFLRDNPDFLVLTTQKHESDLSSLIDLQHVFSQKDLFEIPTTVILRFKPVDE